MIFTLPSLPPLHRAMRGPVITPGLLEETEDEFPLISPVYMNYIKVSESIMRD